MRDCCCPGRSSGRPGNGWGRVGGWRRLGGRRRSAALLVPHPGSRLAFSHTLSLLLYLSLIIRPVLRNPRLPPWQLLLIYPPRLRKARWHCSPWMGRAGDERRGMPVAPGTCSQCWARPWHPGGCGGSSRGAVCRAEPRLLFSSLGPLQGSLLWERANQSPGSAHICGAAKINSMWGSRSGREWTRCGRGCWEPVALLHPGGG